MVEVYIGTDHLAQVSQDVTEDINNAKKMIPDCKEFKKNNLIKAMPVIQTLASTQ